MRSIFFIILIIYAFIICPSLILLYARTRMHAGYTMHNNIMYNKYNNNATTAVIAVPRVYASAEEALLLYMPLLVTCIIQFILQLLSVPQS